MPKCSARTNFEFKKKNSKINHGELVPPQRKTEEVNLKPNRKLKKGFKKQTEKAKDSQQMVLKWDTDEKAKVNVTSTATQKAGKHIKKRIERTKASYKPGGTGYQAAKSHFNANRDGLHGV